MAITNCLLSLQGKESFDLKLLQQQLNEVKQGIDNMVNVIQAGIITAEPKQRLAELEVQKEQLEQQILRERIKNPALTRKQISFFLEQYKTTNVNDETQRQRLIDSIVNSIYVFDDEII